MKGDVDDLLLQRLVDREMSDEERCRFLSSLDARPQLWRTLALAFVEEQLWSGVLRREIAVESRQSKSARQSQPVRAQPRRSGVMLAIAASLLAMAGLGYQIGRQHELRQTVAESSGNLVNDKPQPAEAAAVTKALDAQAAPYRLQLLYRGGDREQSLELPVYDASELPGAFWQVPDVAAVEDLNRELADRGYRIDWSTEYLSRNLDGGKRLLVPLQTVALQHHGQ